MTPHNSSVLAGLALLMITKHPSITKKIRSEYAKILIGLLDDKEAIKIGKYLTGEAKRTSSQNKESGDAVIAWAKGVHSYKIPKHQRS